MTALRLPGDERRIAALQAGRAETEHAMAVNAEIQRLTAENAKLRDRVSLLERRCGQLVTDGDNRERAAMERAEDCEHHGAELKHWHRQAEWLWAAAGQQENARQSIVQALQLLVRDELRGRDQVPVSLLTKWIQRVIDAQNKVPRKPQGWAPLEQHLHAQCVCSGMAGPRRVRELTTALGDVLAQFHEHAHQDEFPVTRTSWQPADRVQRWRDIYHAPAACTEGQEPPSPRSPTEEVAALKAAPVRVRIAPGAPRKSHMNGEKNGQPTLY